MFERYTEHARQAVIFAQDEARALKHNYVGTEHLLLGLAREEAGVAANVLKSLGLTPYRVRARISCTKDGEVTTGQIPFTPRAKKVLELALREALSLGHNYIGTEHILFGLTRLDEGAASNILRSFELDKEKIRMEIVRQLSGRSNAEKRAEAGAFINQLASSGLLQDMDPLGKLGYARFHRNSQHPQILTEAIKTITDAGGRVSFESTSP